MITIGPLPKRHSSLFSRDYDADTFITVAVCSALAGMAIGCFILLGVFYS